ncbi:MAG TPA: HAMP domain-containing sensor histidine kinase [Gaiellaceae bacterium]|nr:HAMP domain-containing sensor histidine kinase [Gaiellaceae bacterium]
MTAFGSLRVRLPLVFLGGILIAGVVTTLIAVRLFQNLARNQTFRSLSREANGIAYLESRGIAASYGNKGSKPGTSNDRKPPQVAAESLAKATGDRIYYVGPRLLYPGQQKSNEPIVGLKRLPLDSIPWISGRSLTFEFRPPGAKRTYLAAANPIFWNQQPIAAIVVARPQADISSGVAELLKRLAIALALGLVVAGGLAWYLSRRIVRPILQLSDAADAVAGGSYAVDVPVRAPGELGHLSERFGEMAGRLAEAEEMERNFLMSVSHELRTPLTAIRGHVSALLEGVVDDPDLERVSLETVEAEATRLERLVGDILDLAKLDAHRFTVTNEEVDMGALVDRAYETYRDEARRRSIDLRREVRDNPVITSDGDRVLQIVGNLMSNAFHATPDGGRIVLELAQRNGTVHVAVEDSGPGIPASQRERLFRPFVSESGGGTGLGLAIAKELSTALGGRIELVSELGKGSRFELLLPSGGAPSVLPR